MKTVLRIALLALLVPGFANATLIGFEPADATTTEGGDAVINIVATPENGEFIGAYDFLVNFDPSILALNSVTFGDSLNNDQFFCDLLNCRGFADLGGALSLFEFAALIPLDGLQDGIGSILLATLRFDAIGVGTSALSFTGNVLGQAPPFDLLGDEFGIPLPVFEPGTGSITVAVAVPEPGTLALMLFGLLMLLALHRRLPALSTANTDQR